MLVVASLALPMGVLAEDPRPPPDFQRFTWSGTVSGLGPGTSIFFDVDRVYSNGELPPDDYSHREGIRAPVAADDLRMASAVDIRSALNLNAADDLVCQLLSVPSLYDDDWSTWLTPLEHEKLARWTEIDMELEQATIWAYTQPGFIGRFLDPRRDGLPVFLFDRNVAAARTQLKAIVPAEIEFEVQLVDRDRLARLARTVREDEAKLRGMGIEVVSVRVEVQQNDVEVGLRDATEGELSELEQRYDGIRAYVAGFPTDGRIRAGNPLYLRNLSCYPISGLSLGKRYLVTIDYVQSHELPPSDVAVWQLDAGRARLVYARGKPATDERYGQADTLSAALGLALPGIPPTDTLAPTGGEGSPSPNWMPPLIGALAGLLFLLRARRLSQRNP